MTEDLVGWVVRVYVCDHCQDAAKEAHPYGVDDRQGNYWDVLCNECYEMLGCNYGEMICEEETCPECGGTGVRMSCFDDICVGSGFCIHGDGEDICPVCDGDGVIGRAIE